MIQTKERVTHNGKTYESGDVIVDINTEEALRLVGLGAAVIIPKIVQQTPEPAKLETTPEPTHTPPVQETDLIPNPDPRSLNAEEELDGIEYNDLKSIAKDAGVEYSGNISKPNLIKAIIEQNKVKEVLEQTEVDE